MQWVCSEWCSECALGYVGSYVSFLWFVCRELPELGVYVPYGMYSTADAALRQREKERGRERERVVTSCSDSTTREGPRRTVKDREEEAPTL